jgi:hypothetical protein
MALSQIFLLIVALVLFVIMCLLMWALFCSLCQDIANLIIKVHDHTKG